MHFSVTPELIKSKQKGIVKSKSKHLRQMKIINSIKTEHVFPQCMDYENYINFISSRIVFTVLFLWV